MDRLNTSTVLQMMYSMHVGFFILINGVRGTMENDRSRAFTSGNTIRWSTHRHNHTTAFNDTNSRFNDTNTRYIPPYPLSTSNTFCKLCNNTWSVPFPQLLVRGQTCSYWNNKFRTDSCLTYQSTFGAVCGCSQVPIPPCSVCNGYGDYIWTLTKSSQTSYIVDQCIKMILDLSKDSRVCSTYRLFVAKLCCTEPPTSDVVSSITDKLPTDDHYVHYRSDDYSYTGPVYDDHYIRFDDYYLGHGKGKGAKKGPKNDRKYGKKKNAKKLKKSKFYKNHNDDHIFYPHSKSKVNHYYHDDHIHHVPYRYY